MANHAVRIRAWARASAAEQRDGMECFLSIFYGGLIIDSIVVRRTEGGRLTLAFPEKPSRSGRPHALVRPIDTDMRKEIEKEILGQLHKCVEVGAGKEGQS